MLRISRLQLHHPHHSERRRVRRAACAGDTLVEVLIAMAVVATMLVGAFKLTHLSQNSVRDSQEHAEALTLAQSEVEFLKQNNGIDAGSTCYDDQGTEWPGTGNQCAFDNTGGWGCDTALNTYCYTVNITSTPSTDPTLFANTYNVNVSWPNLFNGTGSLDLVYRPAVVQTSAPASPSNPSPASASVTHKGGDCGPTTNPCRGRHSPGATYHWTSNLLNNSPSSESGQVASCTWDFGDGSALEHTSCEPGDSIRHPWTPPNGWPSKYNPSKCGTIPETVTLTLVLDSGASATTTHHLVMPQCY